MIMLKDQTKNDLITPSVSSLLRNQDSGTLNEFIKFENHLENDRKKFMSKVHDYLAEIQCKLVSLKSEVHGDYAMEIRDAEYYRVSMFQLEGEITKLKQSINIELCNLMREETELSRDIQFMERRIEEWTKPVANIRNIKSAAPTYNPSGVADTNDPFSSFTRFVASSGGHTGGWDEHDHILFLRERRKYKGKPKFIQAVHSFLPDISEEAIADHDNWYNKYEVLKKEQKEAIKKWRATKHSSLDRKQDSSTDERETSAPKLRPTNYADQRDITERIKEWKRQQLIKKAEEEERQKQEAQRLHEERLKKREVQKSKKLMVNAYKAEKRRILEGEMLANQMKELQAMEDRAKKNVLLKAFREQDQEILEKKRMQKFQAEWKEKRRQERLRKVKPAVELAVERDPHRVLQPTQTWQQHVTQLNHPTAAQALTLQTIPHLAVPNWRKGLNNINTQTL